MSQAAAVEQNPTCPDTLRNLNEAYRIAQAAEALAMVELQRLQDSQVDIAARTPADIVAKLEMAVGSEHDVEDRSVFPLPQLISALRDLKSITQHPTFRRDRATTRVDVSQYWNAAIRQISEHSS